MPIADFDGTSSPGSNAPGLKDVIIAAAPWLFAAVVAVLALL